MNINKKHMWNMWILFIFLLLPSHVFSQNIDYSATYFIDGINSPFAIGIDYDVGFAKMLSFNVQFIGGINSQVNRYSTFGEVFFAEFQFSPRLYLNKIDTWQGVFIEIKPRIGYYDLPFRAKSELILKRSGMLQYGIGLYIGYRWRRNLVRNMKDFPFALVLEPFLGWTLDSFAYSGPGKSTNINRFTFGLSFKIGFFTYKKSAASLAAEQLEKEASDESKTENLTSAETSQILKSEETQKEYI